MGAKVDDLDLMTSRLKLPDRWLETIAMIVILVVPAGHYFGIIRHCFANVLYSDNLPIGHATHHYHSEYLESWDTLGVAFPNESFAYRGYFRKARGGKLSGRAGDDVSAHVAGRKTG